MKKQYDYTLNETEKRDLKENLNNCRALQDVYVESINGSSIDFMEISINNGDINEAIDVHRTIKLSIYGSLFLGLFLQLILSPILIYAGEFINSFKILDGYEKCIRYLSENISMMHRIKRAIRKAS